MRILIVEDQVIVAMVLEDMLSDAGHEIAGSVPDVASALELIDTAEIDVACLDYNLERGTSVPVADRLTELGIPFIFMSGGAIPDSRFDDVPIMPKPFKIADIEKALVSLPR